MGVKDCAEAVTSGAVAVQATLRRSMRMCATNGVPVLRGHRESERFIGFSVVSATELLPKTFEKPGFFQLIDIAVIVISCQRCLLRGEWIDQLESDKLLGQVLEHLRRHARILANASIPAC